MYSRLRRGSRRKQKLFLARAPSTAVAVPLPPGGRRLASGAIYKPQHCFKPPANTGTNYRRAAERQNRTSHSPALSPVQPGCRSSEKHDPIKRRHSEPRRRCAAKNLRGLRGKPRSDKKRQVLSAQPLPQGGNASALCFASASLYGTGDGVPSPEGEGGPPPEDRAWAVDEA